MSVEATLEPLWVGRSLSAGSGGYTGTSLGLPQPVRKQWRLHWDHFGWAAACQQAAEATLEPLWVGRSLSASSRGFSEVRLGGQEPLCR